MKAVLEDCWFDLDDVRPGDLVSLNGLILEPSVEQHPYYSTVTICEEEGMGVGLWLGHDLLLSSLHGGTLMKLVRRNVPGITDVHVLLTA